MKILNIGSLNIDFVYQVDHMVTPGETLSAASREVFCGGKGLNQSIALARAGLPVYHAGCIGADGILLKNVLEENGVNTDFVQIVDQSTGHAIIQVDPSGQNCILLFGGANMCLTSEYIDAVLKNFGEGDYLLLQNEVNDMPYLIEAAYAKKMKIILNPSPYNSALEQCDLKKVSLFMLNEVEGLQMTKESAPQKILESLMSTYPNAQIVLTLGEYGSMYQDQKEHCFQEIYTVDTVDTTAAGDTFTGYFIAGMLEGLSARDSLDLAAKASSIAVSRPGASPSIPYRKEVL